MLAQMLMQQPVQQNDGTVFGGLAQAFAQGAKGYMLGKQMAPGDQGLGSWMPVVTKG